MQADDFVRRKSRIEFKNFDKAKRRKRAMKSLIKRSRAILVIRNNKVIGYRMKDGKVACVKHRYRTQEFADYELSQIARTAQHGHLPVRVYKCDFCFGFHLTSRKR